MIELYWLLRKHPADNPRRTSRLRDHGSRDCGNISDDPLSQNVYHFWFTLYLAFVKGYQFWARSRLSTNSYHSNDWIRHLCVSKYRNIQLNEYIYYIIVIYFHVIVSIKVYADILNDGYLGLTFTIFITHLSTSTLSEMTVCGIRQADILYWPGLSLTLHSGDISVLSNGNFQSYVAR